MVNTQFLVKKSLTKPDGFQKIWMSFHTDVMAPKKKHKHFCDQLCRPYGKNHRNEYSYRLPEFPIPKILNVWSIYLHLYTTKISQLRMSTVNIPSLECLG